MTASMPASSPASPSTFGEQASTDISASPAPDSHQDAVSGQQDNGSTFGIVPIKAADDAASVDTNRVHLFERVRFQLGGGLIFCGLLPMVVRTAVSGSSFTLPATFQTGIMSCIAIILGYGVFRGIRTFPGSVPSTFAVSTFATAFAVVAIVPLVLRIDYSWTQLVAHFAMTMLFYGLIERGRGGHRQLRFAVIPGGSVKRIPALPNVVWEKVTRYDQRVAGVHGVVADLDTDHSPGWDTAMTRYLMAGLPVYHWKQLIEQLCGTVEIEHLSENYLGGLNPNQLYLKAKTSYDWIAAAVLIVLLAPVMLLIALAIRLESPGPSIFRQKRTGFRAESITVYKFRTMGMAKSAVPDAESQRHLAITQPNDNRITRIGRFLRKSRLDELPQLFNVLKAEMSLIGPRPEAEQLTLWYEKEIPFYHYRHIIKPGITGWAQINQGHVAEIDDIKMKLAYDFYYVKNFSPWLDLLIAVRTIVTAFTGRGAR